MMRRDAPSVSGYKAEEAKFDSFRGNKKQFELGNNGSQAWRSLVPVEKMFKVAADVVK